MSSSARQRKMRARLQQKSRSLNLKYASDDLRRDRKVVITAVLNHPGALVYCLDEALRTELTGLRRAQLQELLKTADADMVAKPAEPMSAEQRDLEALDFETMLRQAKEEDAAIAAAAAAAAELLAEEDAAKR